MADKDKELTMEQKVLLALKGYQPALYEVLQDYPGTMLIRNKQTKEPAIIFKKGGTYGQ